MATVQGNPDRQSADDLVGTRLHRVRSQALVFLPGAVLLFAFQIVVLVRPAPPSLTTLPHLALLSSTIWTAGSVLLLAVLLSHRPVLRLSERAQQLIRAFAWTLAFALGALLVGAAGDVFVAVDLLSGSWTLAAVAAGVLIAFAASVYW
jgi:hypothetical protein